MPCYENHFISNKKRNVWKCKVFGLFLFQDRLSSFVLGKCDKNTSTWNLEAGEYGTKGKQVFEVGWWNPISGLRMSDDLFPHVTGGFRGREILVTSMHVRGHERLTTFS